MSTINLFRSALDNNYEAVQVSDAVSIREALPGVDFENAVLSVNGFQVDENYILRDNDLCTIRLFPKGGKGGWNPIDTALTIGLFLINPYLGVAYAAASGLSYAFSNKTLGSWFLDKEMENLPGTPNSPDSLVNIPQLRGAKNQSNKGKPIPLVLGKHLYTPMYIGSPYTDIGGEDGEDQYYTALYLLGWGKLKVSDIRLGPVSGLAKNAAGKTDGAIDYINGDGFCDPSFKDSSPRLELRQGASEVGLYPQRVAEERLSIELLNAAGRPPLDVIRFSAKNPQKVQVEITFTQGLISYDSQGNKTDASVGVLIEWRGDPNKDTWYEFGRFGTNGGSSPTQYNSASRTTTITRQKAKVMRFVAERSFTYSEVSGAIDRTIEIRVIRASPKPVGDTRTADTIFLSAIRTWCFDNEATMANNNVMVPQAPMIQKYRDKTARLGFRIKATENLQGTMDALNCIVESYARTWDGAAWSEGEEPTNNPASIALKVLQSPALGNNAYPDTMLDLDSFGEFYQWCKDREYTSNGVLTSDKRVDDLLSAILATGRGMRILNGNRYGILIDKPRENPVMILNSQNVLEAKNEKAFEDLPDGFSVKFVNELDGYQETEVNVMADGSATPGPLSRIESIEMPFVTDYKQAVKNARYMLACRYLRPEVWIRKLSVDGYLISMGDRVEVQDDTIVVGLGEGGMIKSIDIMNNVITKIYTDGVLEVSDMTKVYGLKIMQADGVNPIKIRTVPINDIHAPGKYSNFAVYIPLTDSDQVVPQVGDIVAFGEYSKITTPAICFGKKDHGDGTFEVTLIPYQEGIYTTDSGPIPPYEANITAPQKLPPLSQIPPEPVTKNDVVEIAREISSNERRDLIYRLYPSVNVVKIDREGTINPKEISCEQYSLMANGYLKESNMTLKYMTSENDKIHDYEGPVKIDAEWEWIEFLLYNAYILLDAEIIPILRNGKQAVKYELLPSSYVIRKMANGTIEPAEISCAQQSKTAYDEIAESDNDIVYVTSDDPSEEIPYDGAVTINSSWEWIEFRLYEGDALLDAEHVEILSEGSSKFSVGLLEDSISILCDEDGYPKNGELPVIGKAGFYVGSDTASNDIEKYKKQILSYPGAGADIFSPMSTSVYPVSINNEKDIIKWELENAPEGITIDRNGTIIIGKQANIGEDNKIIVRGIYNVYEFVFSRQIIPFPSNGLGMFSPIGEYPVSRRLGSAEKILTIKKVYDEKSKTLVNIDNDQETFIFDKFGLILEVQLPFSTKATLFRGTEEVVNGVRWSYEILFNDEMNENALVLSEVIKNSVAINNKGEITVTRNLLMIGSFDIDVQAEYRGIVYTKVFSIKMTQTPDAGSQGVPRYLGKTYIVTGTNVVNIYFTELVQSNVAAVIGDYISYVGPDEPGASNWKKNFCLQWNGSGWAQLDPLNSANTDYYMRALRDITDGAGMGVFSVILAQKIMALEVVADRLETEIIRLRTGGAIIGGTKYSDKGAVLAGHENDPGFWLGANGVLKAASGEFSGHIEADSGTFRGHVEATSGTLKDINATNIYISGNSTFQGMIKPTNGIQVSHYWGAINSVRTQNDWYQVFKNLIPNIGDKVSVFGGASVIYGTYPPILGIPQPSYILYQGIMVFVERINSNAIELNLFPLNDYDRFILYTCVDGDQTPATYRHYVAW